MKTAAQTRWLFGLMLTLLSLAIIRFSFPRRDILARSEAVFGPDAKLTSDRTYSGYFAAKYYNASSHAWLNGNDLLLVQNRAHNELNFHAFRWNISDGSRSPLPKLEGFFDVANAERPFFWALSPDGRWLVSIRPHDREVIFTVSGLDGIAVQTWTNNWRSTLPVWFSDSRGFIEQIFDDGRCFVRSYRMGSTRIDRASLEAAPNQTPAEFGRDPFAQLLEPSETDTVEFVSLSGGTNHVALRKFTLAVPRMLRESDHFVFPSPRGDHLAWIAYYRQKFPHGYAQRDFPFFHLEPRYVGYLWMSRADGGELRELGRLPPDESVRSVAWDPEATHLSFVHQGQVWLLPVTDARRNTPAGP